MTCIANEFVEILGKYVPPNLETESGATANPLFDEACKALWFAATGEAFPMEDYD